MNQHKDDFQFLKVFWSTQTMIKAEHNMCPTCIQTQALEMLTITWYLQNWNISNAKNLKAKCKNYNQNSI